LQNLAKLGQTVIASIHQPSSILMQKIDNLVLLSEGYTVYSGRYQDVLYHFEFLGFVCQTNYNPADFILDLVSIDYSSEEKRNESENQIQKLVAYWRTQESFYSTEEICNLYPTEKHSNSSFSLLLWRSWLNSIRNTLAFKIKLGTSIFFALVLGAIYSKSSNDQSGIQDKIGILFFISINMAFSNVIGIINLFVEEKLLVQKEIKSGFYFLPTYYLSKILVEIPFTLISPIIFCFILYWLVGLNSQINRFFMFLLIIIIESIVAMFMGIFVSGLSPSVEIATAIAPPLNIVFFMFAGVFINLKNLPKWLQFFPKISFIHWVFESLAINQFKGETFECNSSSTMCIKNGDQVLEMYSLKDPLSTSLLSLSAIGIVFCCLGYFALWWTSPRYYQLMSF
jgi:ABC-type multidrug transport system permease subunit